MSIKPDILDKLKSIIVHGSPPAGSSGDVNALVRTVPLDLLNEAYREIEFLRSRGGAMTQGEPFDDIRRRQGAQTCGND